MIDSLFAEAPGFDIDSFLLTPDQRRAVEHEAGPLIVLAGPGTGKTRVITARVAHMVTARGLNPDQVVAVTFTRKAANELRERLGELVSPRIAGRISASTFHTLGLGILRRFGDVIGLPSNPMVIDSSQRNRLVREIISEHHLYRHAIGKGIEHAIDQANRTIDELRNLGFDSDQSKGWLANAQAKILDGDDQQSRRQVLDRFEEAVQVYEHFESRCRERGWISMDDLILLPTKILKDHAGVASIIRHDCKHVVVDEFQDVNRAQLELIRALCPPTGNPDLCVVGDDDQSIYGFRGADDQAFAHFDEMYSNTQTIALSTNFRSSAQIVRASNEIIQRASVRFDSEKTAEAHAGDVDGSRAELIRLENHSQSGEAIASMLLAMASEHGDGFDFGNCAVIARTKGELENIARVLSIEGIPVDMHEQVRPMDDEGVKDVLAWANIIYTPESGHDLKRVLSRPPYRCNQVEIQRLINLWKKQYQQWKHGDEDYQDPGSLMDWICDRAPGSIKDRADSVRKMVREFAKIASEEVAADTVVEIIKRTGVAYSELSDGRKRAVRIKSLAALIGFARSRADRLDEPGDLSTLLRYIADLDSGEQGLDELPESKIDGETPQMGEVVGESQSSVGSVAMLTAHASKGLEFDTVFIPRVGQHGYPSSRSNAHCALPDGFLADEGDVRDPKERLLDEERRVFFVALTRAKHRAVLLAKVPKNSSTVNFVFELRDGLGCDFIERDLSDVVDSSVGSDAISRLAMEFKSASAIRDVFDRALHNARKSASFAIDLVDQGLIDRSEMNDRLVESGNQIALTRYILRHGEAPSWVNEVGLHELAGKLVGVLETQSGLDHKDADDYVLGEPMHAPLKLSFSKISSYLHCPRCFLTNHILKTPSAHPVPMLVGTVVHEALEHFYKQWRIADAEGGVTPGEEELIALAKTSFFRRWPKSDPFDQDQFEKAIALVRSVWETLHDDQAHIEELESTYVFDFVDDQGVTHTIEAKIDRVDATASGGRRVIDYKTGNARKELVEPKKDDLQFGIYSMALQNQFGDLGPGSVCEYWVLSEGTIGRIGIDHLDMKKIHAKMNKAITGMLAGDWRRSSACLRRGDSADCAVWENARDESIPSDIES